MINQQLIDFIKLQNQKGVPLENTKSALLGAGWSEADIREAYSNISNVPPVFSPTREKTKFNAKIIWLPLLIILVLVGGYFAYSYHTNIETSTVATDTLTPNTTPVGEIVVPSDGTPSQNAPTPAFTPASVPSPNTDLSGVDLVVTDIKVTPDHPIVNKKDVQVEVTIKNIGTLASEKGAPLFAELLGFQNQVPFSGGSAEPLPAGAETKWVWFPYKDIATASANDTPGKKTIKIEVNSDRSIIESNYANNILTVGVEMFSK